MLCKYQSVIDLATDSIFHENSRHIGVRLHFVRDMIENNVIKVVSVHTDQNTADFLTKVVPSTIINHCMIEGAWSCDVKVRLHRDTSFFDGTNMMMIANMGNDLYGKVQDIVGLRHKSTLDQIHCCELCFF